MKILTLLFVSLLSVALLSCSDNESTKHAKATVDLLRKLDSEIQTGVPISKGKETLAAAYSSYRQIDAKQVKPVVYEALGLSVTSYQLALDSEWRFKNERENNFSRPFDEAWKEYQDGLKNDLTNARLGYMSAAKALEQ